MRLFHWINQRLEKMAAPMMKMSQVLLLMFIGVLSKCLADEGYEGQRTLTLEHSFDNSPDPVYTKRGSVVVKSLKSNRAHFTETAPLTTEEKKQLQMLVKNNDIYRLRIPIKSTAKSEEDYVTTFTRACGIYESQLSDHLWIHFDQSGEVIGFSITTEPAHCLGFKVSSANLTSWNTTVDISQTVQGPLPDTQSYIEKLKREEMEKSKGQQSDNRSFFGKYWMYIVPFVLIMMLMSNADQQAGGGGGGR